MPDLDAWPHGASDAIGQAGEFLVWAALISQSGGRLHIFLPLLDRGVDALVHRLPDGAWVALQVKTHTSVHASEMTVAVYEPHLFTDDQLLVAVKLDGDRLAPYSLVTDAATFRRKATRTLDGARVLLVADVPTHPIDGHRWSEELVPTDQLGSRLGAVAPALLSELATAPPDEDRLIGSLGELEVCRHLTPLEDCGLFRPFPDNETVEIVVRRLADGATVGLQVKTAQLDDRHGYRNVLINRSNFVTSPRTFVVAVAWVRASARFHECALLIPSTVVPSISGTSGPYYELHFRPDGSSEPSLVDAYRIQLENLSAEIANRL